MTDLQIQGNGPSVGTVCERRKEKEIFMWQTMTLMLSSVALAFSLLGSVGCSTSNNRSASLRCDHLRGNLRAYNQCIQAQSVRHEWFGILNVRNKDHLKKYLEQQRICSDHGIIKLNPCRHWDNDIGVVVTAEDLDGSGNAGLIVTLINSSYHEVRSLLHNTPCGNDEYCQDQFTMARFITSNQGKDKTVQFGDVRVIMIGGLKEQNRKVVVSINGRTVAQGTLDYHNRDQDDPDLRDYCDRNWDPERCHDVYDHHYNDFNYRHRPYYNRYSY